LDRRSGDGSERVIGCFGGRVDKAEVELDIFPHRPGGGAEEKTSDNHRDERPYQMRLGLRTRIRPGH
jgi:hypothetical protein